MDTFDVAIKTVYYKCFIIFYIYRNEAEYAPCEWIDSHHSVQFKESTYIVHSQTTQGWKQLKNMS